MCVCVCVYIYIYKKEVHTVEYIYMCICVYIYIYIHKKEVHTVEYKYIYIYLLYVLLSHPIHATCSAHLMLLDLVTWITALITQTIIRTVKAYCVLVYCYALWNRRCLADWVSFNNTHCAITHKIVIHTGSGMRIFFIYLWIRASWININNCSTWCDYVQFIIFL